ncbi:MAG: DUF1593 domain-containing protein [Rikenellaceae bacterium]|jgi:hypothetical protein|nr:DUF1593 domain-containing protein [Rikenellaceae bacterium]
MYKLLFTSVLLACTILLPACRQALPEKPRILISTDIGGTDPDDFQSMIHFLMYSDRFDTEGLLSSPSYGEGRKQNILDMIALYEEDLPELQKHADGFPAPDDLRAIAKQGRKGAAPPEGYAKATEGSDWIVRCARQESDRPLWILVWGGLDDVAQALHDAPDIRNKIRVYWIGGPNKKWSANSYAYIAGHFPDLWMIEDNASYRGFFSNNGVPDSISNDNYYERYIRQAGRLGKEFKKHYDGRIKMGDTPSLLYLMNGNPNDPTGEGWGGSFEKMNRSPRYIFNRPTTLSDTVHTYSVAEFWIDGPAVDLPANTPCCTMTIAGQDWDGYYMGGGRYVVRYAFKEAQTLDYTIVSDIPGFPGQRGQIVADNIWPGTPGADDYPLGSNWYTDCAAPERFDGKWQGGKTILKWRSDVLLDWAERWKWLQE